MSMPVDGSTRSRIYRFFSVAFAVLRRAALTAILGLTRCRVPRARRRGLGEADAGLFADRGLDAGRLQRADQRRHGPSCAAKFPGLASRRFTVGSDTDEASAS